MQTIEHIETAKEDDVPDISIVEIDGTANIRQCQKGIEYRAEWIQIPIRHIPQIISGLQKILEMSDD